MTPKRLYDPETEHINELGFRWATKIRKALEPLVISAGRANVSFVDLHRFLVSDASFLLAMANVARHSSKPKRKRKR